MLPGDKFQPYSSMNETECIHDIRSCVSDDSNVEAAARKPQQREQIRKGGATHRAIMCSVMWLLRLLTTCCLVYLSASDVHTGTFHISSPRWLVPFVFLLVHRGAYHRWLALGRLAFDGLFTCVGE